MKRFGLLPWEDTSVQLMNEFFDWPAESSWTIRGQWVDTDKYEIRPKSSYRKELIEKKEAEIKRLKERQEILETEIKNLKE